jgi:hypothetical protein
LSNYPYWWTLFDYLNIFLKIKIFVISAKKIETHYIFKKSIVKPLLIPPESEKDYFFGGGIK